MAIEEEIIRKENALKSHEDYIKDLHSIFDVNEIKHRCKDQKVRFGVTGATGVGKSTFINLLLDAKEGDNNFAETGRGDTTRTVTVYRHPKCDQFTITDMPGYHSTEFTKETILKLYSFSDFDYVLVFFQDALQENDILMAKLLLKNRIPFSFVRTKLDLDIKHHSELVFSNKLELEKAICTLKDQIKKMIDETMEINTVKLFLISNFKENFDKGDLVMLLKDIAYILPEEKSESFLFILPILTPETIKMKSVKLKKRIKKAAARAGATAVFPTPFADIAIKYLIIETEVKHYVEVFGLDKNYVTSVPRLKHDYFKQNRSKLDWTHYIRHGLHLHSKIKTKIPIVGSISYYHNLIISYLTDHLETLEEDALTVYRHFTAMKK